MNSLSISEGPDLPCDELSFNGRPAFLPRTPRTRTAAESRQGSRPRRRGNPGLCRALQPRTFMALGPWLLSLDLPDATRAAWEKLI